MEKSYLPITIKTALKEIELWLEALKYSTSHKMFTIIVRKPLMGENLIKKYLSNQPFNKFHFVEISKNTLKERNFDNFYLEFFDSFRKYLSEDFIKELNSYYTSIKKLELISKSIFKLKKIRLIFILDFTEINIDEWSLYCSLLDEKIGSILSIVTKMDLDKVSEKWPEFSSRIDKKYELNKLFIEEDFENFENIIKIFTTKKLSNKSILKCKKFVLDNEKTINIKIIKNKIFKIVMEELNEQK